MSRILVLRQRADEAHDAFVARVVEVVDLYPTRSVSVITVFQLLEAWLFLDPPEPPR